jgi:hypothetical protein
MSGAVIVRIPNEGPRPTPESSDYELNAQFRGESLERDGSYSAVTRFKKMQLQRGRCTCSLMFLETLGLRLPAQPPPRIRSGKLLMKEPEEHAMTA